MPIKSLLLVLLVSAPALADENSIQLKEGPSGDLVTANCATCHSLDYIPMNSVFMDGKAWEKTVNKMINVMGAPITSEDAHRITEYLTSTYGTR
jgi:hypothetical protein